MGAQTGVVADVAEAFHEDSIIRLGVVFEPEADLLAVSLLHPLLLGGKGAGGLKGHPQAHDQQHHPNRRGDTTQRFASLKGTLHQASESEQAEPGGCWQIPTGRISREVVQVGQEDRKDEGGGTSLPAHARHEPYHIGQSGHDATGRTEGRRPAAEAQIGRG